MNKIVKGGLLATCILIAKKMLSKKTEIRTSDINNIVNSINKSKELESLYKKLMVKVHPDRNPDKQEIAANFTERLNKSRRNYDGLKSLELEIDSLF